VNWYETNNRAKVIIKKKEQSKLIVLKKKKIVKKLKPYFKKYKFKLKRFNKKNYFLVLVDKEKILSSGWINFGTKWEITEINKKVNLNSYSLLFDFETPSNLRNRGNYNLLLRKIRNKFFKKRLAIYSLSTNFKSCRAIEKAGFELKGKINGL